jgi:hypothetical protein
MSDERAVSVPAAQAVLIPRRRFGCLVAVCGYTAWIGVLTLVLIVALIVKLGPVVASLGRTQFLPLYMQVLDDTHTVSQRLAFSNAFVRMLAMIDSNHWTDVAQQAVPPFQQLMVAAQDQAITTNESAAFCVQAAMGLAQDAPELHATDLTP